MTQLKVRLARESDKEPVLDFCEKLSNNQENYIHLVWDKWLADPEGDIFVVTLDGIPVAIERVVRMSQNEAWREGLRVNPLYHRQGLSKILDSQINQYLSQSKIPVSRCCVFFDNEIMNGIMSRRGRKKIGSYALYEAEPINSPIINLIKLEQDDLTPVCSLITNYNFLGEGQKLYISRGAKWQELTTERLRKLIFEEKVWGLKQDKQLLSVVIKSYSESSNKKFWIGYINGSKENLSVLLYEMRKLAHQQGYSSIGGFLPLNEIVSKSLSLANYKILEKEKCWVYQW